MEMPSGKTIHIAGLAKCARTVEYNRQPSRIDVEKVTEFGVPLAGSYVVELGPGRVGGRQWRVSLRAVNFQINQESTVADTDVFACFALAVVIEQTTWPLLAGNNGSSGSPVLPMTTILVACSAQCIRMLTQYDGIAR